MPQGSTTEPSIQLVGGADDQASRNLAKQRLGVAEDNLKKVSGKQLNANQQDLVAQVRQFMKQSNQAIADGDLERASTLASKAKQLSEELAKPDTQ